MGGVITNKPEPRAHSSIRDVSFAVQERNKEVMGPLSTETRVKVIVRKTKGVHVPQIVKHPEYASYMYVFSQTVQGRDLPLNIVSTERSVYA